MLFLNKPLDKITEQDLEEWVESHPREDTMLEFKEQFYKVRDNTEKHELCKDITALANTMGGHLIIGIRTSKENGEDRAVRIVGIEMEQLSKNGYGWIYDVLDSHVKPKLRGVIHQPVTLSDGKVVLIIQVPRSVLGPHAIRTKAKDGRFEYWTRNMQGCFLMDAAQIRQARLASRKIARHMREFRMNRLADLGAGQAPVELPSTGPLFVYHILPINVFDDYTAILPDLHQLSRGEFHNIAAEGHQNADGYRFARQWPSFPNLGHKYTQFYRNGCVEVLYDHSHFLHHPSPVDPDCFDAEVWEMMSCGAVLFALAGLQAAGMDVPVYITAAILRAKGCRFGDCFGKFAVVHRPLPIDEDRLVFQEVLVEEMPKPVTAAAGSVGFGDVNSINRFLEQIETPVRKSLKPICDRLWQAAGYSRSPYYDENGEPKPIPIQ